MPIAITPNETWRFQLEDDYLEKPERDPSGKVTKPGKPDPNGTWWKLRALPAWVHAQVQDLIQFELRSDGQLVHANRGTIMRLVLEHGVAGVEQWKDAQGHDVPFRMRTANGRDVADLSFLDYLKPAHQVELSNAVELRQKVTIEESD